MTLYHETLKEIEQWEQNPHHNLQDWLGKINPILEILQQGTLKHEKIIALFEDNNGLIIHYEYTALGCSNESHSTIPIQVLKADNPVLEAQRYKLQQDLNHAIRQKTEAAKAVTTWLNKELQIREAIANLATHT